MASAISAGKEMKKVTAKIFKMKLLIRAGIFGVYLKLFSAIIEYIVPKNANKM